MRSNSKNWIYAFHINAEEDYKNGRRIYLSECLNLVLESLAICKQGARKASEMRIKKYFLDEIKIGKIQLNELMLIKESWEGTEREHMIQKPS